MNNSGDAQVKAELHIVPDDVSGKPRNKNSKIFELRESSADEY